MCLGGGPVGPQKYKSKREKERDSEGNAFGSKAYHDKIRSDAAARRQPSQSDRPRMRGGAAPRKSFLTRSIDSMFPKG
jgi:hypothetical protein